MTEVGWAFKRVLTLGNRAVNDCVFIEVRISKGAERTLYMLLEAKVAKCSEAGADHAFSSWTVLRLGKPPSPSYPCVHEPVMFHFWPRTRQIGDETCSAQASYSVQEYAG